MIRLQFNFAYKKMQKHTVAILNFDTAEAELRETMPTACRSPATRLLVSATPWQRVCGLFSDITSALIG